MCSLALLGARDHRSVASASAREHVTLGPPNQSSIRLVSGLRAYCRWVQILNE